MKYLLPGMMLCLFSSNLFGQFQFSSVAEKFIAGSDLSGHIRHTSCHSKGEVPFPDYVSDLYVSTWGEGGSQLHYKRTYPGDPYNIISEAAILVPNASVIHDAAILQHPFAPGRYCVAVIFSDNTSGGSIAFYEWATTGLIFMFSNQFTTNYTYNMSLDAIGSNAYAVVFESGNVLYSFGGMTDFTNPFGIPLLSPVTELQTNAPSPGGRLPDVALTQLPGLPNNPSGIKVYYTYVDVDRDLCFVSNYGFDELVFAPPSIPLNYEHQVNPMNFIFGGSTNCTQGVPFPRFFYSPGPKIDAPDKSDDSWAVIVGQEEFYPTLGNTSPNSCAWPMNMNKSMQLQMTAAYKHNGGGPVDIVLNNGSLAGTVDMSSNILEPFNDYLGQSQPAVAFSPEGNDINFAWGKTQQHPAIDEYDYIGLMYSAAGNDIILASSGEGYRIVDRQPDLMPYIRSIAFSGNNEPSIANLYTVFTSSVDNTSIFPEGVYNKHPKWGNIPSDGYKPLNVSDKAVNTLTAYALPNPFNNSLMITVPGAMQQEKYEVAIWDLSGRVALRIEGSIAVINQELNKWTKGTDPVNTNYILQLRSKTSQQQVNLKITRIAQ